MGSLMLAYVKIDEKQQSIKLANLTVGSKSYSFSTNKQYNFFPTYFKAYNKPRYR